MLNETIEGEEIVNGSRIELETKKKLTLPADAMGSAFLWLAYKNFKNW